MQTRLQSVLFDLDGTLADTGPDLAWALNRVLREEGRAEAEYEYIRPVISHGAQAMVVRGFGLEPDAPAVAGLRDRLVAHYAQHIAERTALFPGMDAVLELLENHALRWGVVTNKLAALTDPLLDKLKLTRRACCVVSGDTLSEKKPHPAPILHACTAAGCTPAECLYVGDAERDIEAGRRAGTRTGVALFGYLAEEDTPHAWGADVLFATPQDLYEWLQTQL